MVQNFKSLVLVDNYQDTDKIVGLTLLQGFAFPKARQELHRAIDLLTPTGYSVRISPHELGLSNNRYKFRQGILHMHFEKIGDAKEGEIPTDVSLELWLGATPYAGIIDVKTRKIIVPFSDKQIAQNYLTLLDKYLTPVARNVLQKIAQ